MRRSLSLKRPRPAALSNPESDPAGAVDLAVAAVAVHNALDAMDDVAHAPVDASMQLMGRGASGAAVSGPTGCTTVAVTVGAGSADVTQGWPVPVSAGACLGPTSAPVPEPIILLSQDSVGCLPAAVAVAGVSSVPEDGVAGDGTSPAHQESDPQQPLGGCAVGAASAKGTQLTVSCGKGGGTGGSEAPCESVKSRGRVASVDGGGSCGGGGAGAGAGAGAGVGGAGDSVGGGASSSGVATAPTCDDEPFLLTGGSVCIVCGREMGALTILQREVHRNACLDRQNSDWATQRCTSDQPPCIDGVENVNDDGLVIVEGEEGEGDEDVDRHGEEGRDSGLGAAPGVEAAPAAPSGDVVDLSEEVEVWWWACLVFLWENVYVCVLCCACGCGCGRGGVLRGEGGGGLSFCLDARVGTAGEPRILAPSGSRPAMSV
jgi:hypothetical protein